MSKKITDDMRTAKVLFRSPSGKEIILDIQLTDDEELELSANFGEDGPQSHHGLYNSLAVSFVHGLGSAEEK